MKKEVHLEALKWPKFHIKRPKCTAPLVTTQMEHHLTFGTKFDYFGPYDDLFRGQKAGFVTIGGHKGDQFAHKIALLGPPKGPQWPKNGSRMPIK